MQVGWLLLMQECIHFNEKNACWPLYANNSQSGTYKFYGFSGFRIN